MSEKGEEIEMQAAGVVAEPKESPIQNDETAEEKIQVDNIKQEINKVLGVKGFRIREPQLLDPTVGIIFSQGLIIYHLVYGIGA